MRNVESINNGLEELRSNSNEINKKLAIAEKELVKLDALYTVSTPNPIWTGDIERSMKDGTEEERQFIKYLSFRKYHGTWRLVVDTLVLYYPTKKELSWEELHSVEPVLEAALEIRVAALEAIDLLWAALEQKIRSLVELTGPYKGR